MDKFDTAAECLAPEERNCEGGGENMQMKTIQDTTVAFYSHFVCTDLSGLAGGVHFVCSPERDEEVRGFGCKYGAYILVRDGLCVAAYSPKYKALFQDLKDLSAEQLVTALKRRYRLRRLKIFVFCGEKIKHFAAARLLEPIDYPLYEAFFRETNPDADPECWLCDYFTEKVDRGLFAGSFADGKLVSVCDAPDMPYMVGRIQHTGIMTRADARCRGYGKAAAALLTHHLIESGVCPQWECEAENAGSIALARSIGYEEYAEAYILEEALSD